MLKAHNNDLGSHEAKSEKLNLDVVWLDLANGYGSVPHQMIQLAPRMCHVPEDIQVMLDKYFNGFRIKFPLIAIPQSGLMLKLESPWAVRYHQSYLS